MYIERDILGKFSRASENYGVVALVGPRQSGKTTFLREHMKDHRSEYVLFDDIVARSMFNDEFKQFEVEYIDGRDLTVLDEVQHCEDAGSKLKYLVDTGSKLWITSSSEVLLGRDVLSHLVGRVKVLRLHTFSFPEFLRAKGHRTLPTSARRSLVGEHMTYGGYPRAVLSDDVEFKREYLTDLHGTLLLKDVARTFGLRKMTNLERLSKHLSLVPGALMNVDTTSSTLDINRHTLTDYLDAMVKSYVVHRVQPFYTNKRKEIVRQERYYFTDTGLRNAIASDFRTDPDGHVFENYVLTELLKMDLSPKYWRTQSGAEVDFVIDDDEVVPIEVKRSVDPRRVERSMRSFIRTYKPPRAFMVGAKGRFGDIEVDGCNVVYTDLPGLWEHLVGKDLRNIAG